MCVTVKNRVIIFFLRRKNMFSRRKSTGFLVIFPKLLVLRNCYTPVWFFSFLINRSRIIIAVVIRESLRLFCSGVFLLSLKSSLFQLQGMGDFSRWFSDINHCLKWFVRIPTLSSLQVNIFKYKVRRNHKLKI